MLQNQRLLQFFIRELTKPRRRHRGEVSLPVPENIDWFIWRVLTAECLSVTLTELKTTWTLLDLADAHDALDLIDQLNHKARTVAEQQRTEQ